MNKIKNSYDVIVVGAGPAGAVCAYKLSKYGMKVLLIEKEKLPRNKTCTGIVTQNVLRIIEQETGKSPMNQCVFPYYYKFFSYYVKNNAKPINIGNCDEDKCYSFTRADFDYWLVSRAKEQSVDVIELCTYCEIIYMTSESIRVKVMLRNNGEAQYFEVDSKYLIAADGMNSKIRTQLFPERNIIKKNFCRQEYYEGSCDLDPHVYHTFVTNPVAKEPIWFFFKDKYVVLGFHAYSNYQLQQKRKQIIAYLKDKYNLKVGKLIRSEVCCETTNYTVQKLKTNKLDFVLGKKNYPVLFVGEAAEMVDAVSSGIYVAVKTGCLAAEAVHLYDNEEIRKGRKLYDIYEELSKEILNDITENWTKFYYKMKNFF